MTMTDAEKKAYVLSAIESAKSDDLRRAQAAFRRCSPAEMDQEYGESGRTRRQILQSYEDFNAKVDEILVWLKGKLDAD
jgi:hypothetical protein